MGMTFDLAMHELESLGTEATRRTYLRHGAREPLFGVRFGDLRPLARSIGTDHRLARELWASGNTDARLLACMVADPGATSDAELDAWLADIEVYFLVDAFVGVVAVRVPGVRERAERWIASDRDRTAQAGWDLVSYLATSDPEVPDDYLEARLDDIAARMQGYGNWTRRAASNAITCIGLRDERLEAAARRTAAGMGKVAFDPGQTSCVMPDPIAYIERTKAYRAGQAAKREARVEAKAAQA